MAAFGQAAEAYTPDVPQSKDADIHASSIISSIKNISSSLMRTSN
jgi:hypothetical protein